ncbi:MAG: hypothetical protein JW891_15715 [Candidatus Lokiarchaeota archaeon]|nr:hypothetical protein [Candidatus Lokiarchaeota archaeon]
MKLPKEMREKKEIGVSKSKSCSVVECKQPAIRSLSENKWNKYLEKAKLNIEENKQHKVFLCKSHYKEANKVRKSEEKLYQKKGFLDDLKAGKKGQYLGE